MYVDVIHLQFRKLADTYAQMDLAGDPVFYKFGNELVYPAMQGSSTIRNDSMGESTTTLIEAPTTISAIGVSPGMGAGIESGRVTPQVGGTGGNDFQTPAHARMSGGSVRYSRPLLIFIFLLNYI